MKLVLRLLLALVSFLIGLVGMYFAMPYIAPQRVQQVQQQLDSLRAVAEGDSIQADSLVFDPVALFIDSLTATRDTLHQLRDSIRILHQQLTHVHQTLQQLQQQLQQVQQRLSSLETQRAKAKELAATITRLEDDQRRALLSQLPPEILDLLYLETQGRGRTLLLQSLPPDQAARLVRRLMQKPGGSQEPALTSAGSQSP
ncbi:hypothetical protein [Rhodothermus profundi]|uniref:Flagellar motility protein MotE, a chaperone for MotC folding n=1 Tax=Rhodothermus profundi TaxID=633813 RepID=A0A1M6X6Z6_9BACT|nr:hypothetical protein [Rhodothermus profundi]SHL01555.1 Flagellar motility protein MotE, a chaperone for MotC folding [Rhodothermus profundi]